MEKRLDRSIFSFLRDKKGTAPSFIEKFPGGFRVFRNKLYAGDLLVIPTEEREDYLRNIVYGKKSEYPFGRDSLFAILKHEVMNVSKRDIEAFLNAQGPLVHRRARPKREKRVHLRKIKNPGQLSVDLVHVRAKDFEKLFQPASAKGLDYMGPPGSARSILFERGVYVDGVLTDRSPPRKDRSGNSEAVGKNYRQIREASKDKSRSNRI